MRSENDYLFSPRCRVIKIILKDYFTSLSINNECRSETIMLL